MGDAQPGGWLVVVDMQRVFADARSPWFNPAFTQVAPLVERLVSEYAERTVFTRFLPVRDDGSWADYYERWGFAKDPATTTLWQLAPPWTAQPSIDTGTFSKWDRELVGVVGECPELVVCGVATDCCVLATVFAAVDAGAHVTVVADACAGSSPLAHDQALQLMRNRDPQVRIVDSEGASDRWSKH